MTAATSHPQYVDLVEPFRYYAVDWARAFVRTDTPDLIGLFEDVREHALMAEGAAEFADEDLAIAEADMGAGAETLPPE